MGEQKWIFVVALPGVSIEEPVLAKGTAIVTLNDPWYANRELVDEPRIKKHLSMFRTVLREPVTSTLILRRLGARQIGATEVAFLRNCFAVPIVLLGRARQNRHFFGGKALFSDLFDIPATQLKRFNPGLIIETPTVLASGPQETFCGHPSPTYPFGKKEHLEWDKPLLEALLSVWALPSRGPRSVLRKRVARILEITYTAMRAPSHNLQSGNDWGILFAMWVSAFETMTNIAGSVGFPQVRTIIEAVPWPKNLKRPLVAYEYRSRHRRGGGPLDPMTRPIQTYARLYRARNMVMHGEEYENERLEPGRRHGTWGVLHWRPASCSDALFFNG